MRRAWMCEAWLLAEVLVALSVYTVLPAGWVWVAGQVVGQTVALMLVLGIWYVLGLNGPG